MIGTDMISPLLSNYSYIMDMANAKRSLKKEEKVSEFQKILLEQIFAKSFVPDQDEMQVVQDEDDEENMFTDGQKPEIELQNQMMRKTLVETLVKLDPLGLQRAFKKMT